MIVAGQREYASVRRRTGGVGVREHVAGSVDARSLAVPHGENAIEPRPWEQTDLLASPDRGCAKVLVNAGLEVDAMAIGEFLGSPKSEIETAERRSPISRDEASRVETRRRVSLPLHHRETNQRLGSGEINAPALAGEFIVQANVREVA